MLSNISCFHSYSSLSIVLFDYTDIQESATLTIRAIHLTCMRQTSTRYVNQRHCHIPPATQPCSFFFLRQIRKTNGIAAAGQCHCLCIHCEVPFPNISLFLQALLESTATVTNEKQNLKSVWPTEVRNFPGQ